MREPDLSLIVLLDLFLDTTFGEGLRLTLHRSYELSFLSMTNGTSLLVAELWAELPDDITLEGSSKDIMLGFCRIFTWYELGSLQIEGKVTSLEGL